MRYFWRSLRYLRPYRLRLGVAIACVLCIAVLWGGGLGMVLPGAKIFLTEEGLHGWAWQTLAEDHLGAKVVEQDPAGALSREQLEQIFGDAQVRPLLSLVSINKKGPCARAGIGRSAWLVGLDEAVIGGRELLPQLARLQPGQKVALHVYWPQVGPRTVTITVGSEALLSRVLKSAAERLPEPRSMADRFNLFVWLLVVALVLTLLRGLFTFIQEYLVGTAIWRGIVDLRSENYNTVLHLPTSFFSEKGVSDATSRFIQDTNELARGQNTLLGKTLVEPAKAVGALVIALVCSWELTLLALLAGPPTFLLIRRLGRKMHKASKRALESWSGMLAVLTETLLGIRVVKSYTMEAVQRRRFFAVNRRLLKQQYRKERLDALTGPMVEALGLAAGMAAAGVAGYLVFVGYRWGGELQTMDREYFLTWMLALAALFDPVRKLAKVSMRFQEAEAAARRVFELQDTPREKAVGNAPGLPRHRESLEFKDVTFRYPSAAADALRNVNLTIQAGQTIAIVGPNGCGKTTLVSLVPRLFDPKVGQVLLDGRDIAQHSVRSLRRQIGLVTQESVLFAATIAENIACGRRRTKPQAVHEAAKKAFVDEFVRDLPAGYDTLVGEHGSTLSGGQRQRIAIARAILRDPAILILDEALSQIDPDSERKIHQVLLEFRKGRTTLVIAHRFATILQADRIVVMDAGRIVDEGTHEQLLSRCGRYRLLYRNQSAAPAEGAAPLPASPAPQAGR